MIARRPKCSIRSMLRKERHYLEQVLEVVFLTSTSSPRTYSLQCSLPSCKAACAASGCLTHRDGLDLIKLRPERNCIHLEYPSHPLQRPILEGNLVRFVSFHTTLLDNIKNPERCQNIMLWELSFQRVGVENEKGLALFSAGQQKLRLTRPRPPIVLACCRT